MILVVNGCSHTTGAEIDSHHSPHCFEKAWPAHLAELLGWEVINLARSGGSAKRVVRTTINWLGGHYKKEMQNKIIFIALWPGVSRTELRTDRHLYENDAGDCYEEDGMWITLNTGNLESYERAAKDGWFPKPVLQYYKHWLNVVTQEEFEEQHYLNIISLQSVLKSLGVPYIFQNSTSALNWTNPYARLHPLVDKRWFPGWNNYKAGYDQILKSQGFKYPEWSTSHFGEDGHKWYAKYMYQMLKSKYPHLTSAE